MRYLLLTIAMTVSALLAAPAAYAHVEVIGTRPGNGDRLSSAPDEIRIHYAPEPKLQSGTGSVLGPNGGRWESGPARVEGNNLVIPVRPAIAGRLYTIEFSAQSADQHRVPGTLSFEVVARQNRHRAPPTNPHRAWTVHRCGPG